MQASSHGSADYSALRTNTRRLTGWGRTAPTTSEVLSTSDPEVIARAVTMVAEDNES
ncbi:MAG: decaprenylphosphoryl-beta-D-ribose oxidase, partial [Nocardia sp.]|nr:decaprenylphosphoryl-beta-D-ribose oxidase [Nocardia sp.]